MSSPAKVPEYLIPTSVHWVALAAVVFTWPLLLVGGSVTVYHVGMAVTDWPTTRGVNMFLYDFLNSPWGIFLEHSHRLYGSAVGLACIILAVWFSIARTPGWLKALGFFALMAVIGQGVLGGVRVLRNSTGLAFFHGCTAQAFFGLMVALCVLTGRSWFQDVPRQADAMHMRRRTMIMLGLVYLQIVLGALVRHYPMPHTLYLHAFVATTVWGHALALMIRARRYHGELAPLVPSAVALGIIATVQVVLGILNWWVLRPFTGELKSVYPVQALLRLAHQGIGALLLAASVILTMRAYQYLRGAPRPMNSPAPTRLETVA